MPLDRALHTVKRAGGGVLTGVAAPPGTTALSLAILGGAEERLQKMSASAALMRRSLVLRLAVGWRIWATSKRTLTVLP